MATSDFTSHFPMDSDVLLNTAVSRRKLLNRIGLGFGGIALADLLRSPRHAMAAGGSLGSTHHPATSKRVIYLFQSGGPSQLETFDYKPLLNERQGQPLPDSVRKGQRLTGMSGNQASLPLAGSAFKFAPQGQSGAWISEYCLTPPRSSMRLPSYDR